MRLEIWRKLYGRYENAIVEGICGALFACIILSIPFGQYGAITGIILGMVIGVIESEHMEMKRKNNQ